MGSFVAADASALTTSVTTLTGVTWPSHAADDVALVAWASDNTQTRTEPPTGFTSEFTNADGSLRAIVASLGSTGSESGDVSLVCGAANRQAGVIAVYRGYNPNITNITSQNETSGTAVTSHSSPSITPTDSASAVVLIYMDRVTSSVLPTAPAGYTVRGSFATGGSGGVTVVVADKLSGLTAGVPESPAAWTGGTASTAAYVIALELTPVITGTAAVTEATDTSSASGQLGYSGTASLSEAADTSSASGSVSGGSISGTAAPVQAGNTSSATGSLGYSGTAAVTQSAQTSTTFGQLGYSGTSALTQAGETSSASGTLGYSGTLARTQAANTSAASGTFTVAGVAGTAAVTQANETPSASGQLGYSGSSARTQANQTSSATGQLGYAATGSPAQAANTSSATGAVINPVVGTAAPVQAGQVAAASGLLQFFATGDAVQGDDTPAAIGIFFIPALGTVAVTQAGQTADAAGVALGRTIIRPDLGTTSRTSDGVTPRPFAGITPRP